ncbi:alpha/beta fold hydrolase [Caenimonas sedimenti]|uniref:Alpha/beta fold hydrolase n=1 Tax=Caenimonas sedimenti TaxID=2596921 RepID=A0A562ZR14_9BURK|nr:alpha/beta fold hydrolase [Caenimonas sedimenti]TWO70748.1 alpha/beta fold hydrolase [Caenimonas sedimenti]
MPATSSLARLQQVLCALVVLAAVGWWTWRWPASPLQAVTGSLAILGVAVIVLAAEFVLLAFVARTDTAPVPTTRELVRAWIGETRQFFQVFCWRQPFRWREVDDHLAPETRSKRGVVFIHGFVCNRGFWTPWMRMLRARGHAYVAVNLEPVYGSIDDYAATVDSAVERVIRATGLPPLLVCHSMGGLVARAWLRHAGSAERAYGVVTMGSPHGGTWLGRFSRRANGLQMRLASPWLAELGRYESGRSMPFFVCWYTPCDNIVFPASTATLPGADNRLVRGVAHVDLAFQPEVMDHTMSLLQAANSKS